MGEPGDGWQTVLPTSHSGIERLGRAQLEAYERQVLKDWEATRGHWSGVGKHTSAQDFSEAKKLHQRFKPAVDKVLGSGTYGVVEKVHYGHNNRSVCLARKWIQYRRGRTIQLLREEANVMEKLDHRHILRLIGTYCVRQGELFLLLWPVAVCNLDSLFNDLDALRLGQGDREDTLRRLAALELTDVSAIERRRPGMHAAADATHCPLAYLRRIVGCIAHAVAYCHTANIRHLDLKPSNILLNPGGNVYLADFGIARDVEDRDHTMTFGLQGTPKWRAPEICYPDDEWSMKAADIYSLGLVLLAVATMLYGADMEAFDAILDDIAPRTRAEKLKQYHVKLQGFALATQEVDDYRASTFGPKHILGLTERMLSTQPSSRPTAAEVEVELVELGGIDQVYHGVCCKKSSRFVTERMNSRLKTVTDERDRLQAEHQLLSKKLEVLTSVDETYESRIQRERKNHAENMTKMQEQLSKERKERERLQSLVTELQHGHGRRPPKAHAPRPSSERSTGTKSAASEDQTIRPRPQTHPRPRGTALPTPAASPLPRPPTSPAAAGLGGPRLTYSQTAAAGTNSVSPMAVRRPKAVERLSTDSFGESPGDDVNRSPTPNSPAGFPMRSRNSASRLPVRSGSGYGPTRSSTPNLNRDNSLTDSTQFSQTSSTFSRLSKESDSVLGTNGVPTPALGSPQVTKSTALENMQPLPQDVEAPMAVEPDSIGLGLGLGMADVPEGDPRGHTSIRDFASVSGSAMSGTVSPMMSGSVMSSPQAPKAELAVPGRMPPLPTAKSWAEVARPQKRR
ncbi:kinase-like protein [Thozetella sp. PMI_491]|nr:kinase-like protein [Thozetella sp. PMI_491]